MIVDFTLSDHNLTDQVQDIVALDSNVIQLSHPSRKMKTSSFIKIVKLSRILKVSSRGSLRGAGRGNSNL